MINSCVMCGVEIPEGHQVCYNCRRSVYLKGALMNAEYDVAISDLKTAYEEFNNAEDLFIDTSIMKINMAIEKINALRREKKVV